MTFWQKRGKSESESPIERVFKIYGEVQKRIGINGRVQLAVEDGNATIFCDLDEDPDTSTVEEFTEFLKNLCHERGGSFSIDQLDEREPPDLVRVALSFEIAPEEGDSSKMKTGNKGRRRGIKWGMNVEQVKRSNREKPLYVRDDALVYRARVGATLSARLFYFFDDEKLCGIAYNFDEQYKDLNDHLRSHIKVKSLLVRKFGPPQEDKTVWRNDEYKNQPQKRAFAVSEGHLVLFSSWRTRNTEISLVLQGFNGKIEQLVLYDQKPEISEIHELKENEWELGL